MIELIFLDLFIILISFNFDFETTDNLHVQVNLLKVSTEMKLLLILFSVENLLCCIPLFILSVNIGKRNSFLTQNFPPIEEENQATITAYSLSIVCPIVYAFAPILQF
jgi:hypothetical protein